MPRTDDPQIGLAKAIRQLRQEGQLSQECLGRRGDGRVPHPLGSAIPMKKLSLTFLLLAALFVLGCGSSSDSSSSTSGSASAANCPKGKLPTQKQGVLTVATDEPAY